MTKTNLKDATKDLLQSSETVMESVADVRKGADVLMHMLRKLENQYVREDELRREEDDAGRAGTPGTDPYQGVYDARFRGRGSGAGGTSC